MLQEWSSTHSLFYNSDHVRFPWKRLYLTLQDSRFFLFLLAHLPYPTIILLTPTKNVKATPITTAIAWKQTIILKGRYLTQFANAGLRHHWEDNLRFH